MKATVSLKPAGAAQNLRTAGAAISRAAVANLPAIVVICGMVSFFSLLFGATVTGFVTGLIALLSIGADMERSNPSAKKGGEL